MSKIQLKKLEDISRKVRALSLEMTTKANSGHPGGSLSETEILVALYFHCMKINPKNPKDKKRDRFILSKGHATPGLYAVLHLKGFLKKKDLWKFRQLGSITQGHTDRNKTPGVEMSGGSLGIGFSVANGMALAAKINREKHRVFVVLGDGETQEGIVWETALFAGNHKLDNLIAIIDRNKAQNDGYVKDIMEVKPLADKFRAFNWNVIECNGHDFTQLIDAIEKAKTSKGRPTVIIAHTIKAHGVSFMDNDPQWHGKALSPEQLEKALRELGE